MDALIDTLEQTASRLSEEPPDVDSASNFLATALVIASDTEGYNQVAARIRGIQAQMQTLGTENPDVRAAEIVSICRHISAIMGLAKNVTGRKTNDRAPRRQARPSPSAPTTIPEPQPTTLVPDAHDESHFVAPPMLTDEGPMNLVGVPSQDADTVPPIDPREVARTLPPTPLGPIHPAHAAGREEEDEDDPEIDDADLNWPGDALTFASDAIPVEVDASEELQVVYTGFEARRHRRKLFVRILAALAALGLVTLTGYYIYRNPGILANIQQRVTATMEDWQKPEPTDVPEEPEPEPEQTSPVTGSVTTEPPDPMGPISCNGGNVTIYQDRVTLVLHDRNDGGSTLYILRGNYNRNKDGHCVYTTGDRKNQTIDQYCLYYDIDTCPPVESI